RVRARFRTDEDGDSASGLGARVSAVGVSSSSSSKGGRFRKRTIPLVSRMKRMGTSLRLRSGKSVKGDEQMPFSRDSFLGGERGGGSVSMREREEEQFHHSPSDMIAADSWGRESHRGRDPNSDPNMGGMPADGQEGGGGMVSGVDSGMFQDQYVRRFERYDGYKYNQYDQYEDHLVHPQTRHSRQGNWSGAGGWSRSGGGHGHGEWEVGE
ncbi:unnamed protein product, partial [Discosporangium mesarthrocarpum]